MAKLRPPAPPLAGSPRPPTLHGVSPSLMVLPNARAAHPALLLTYLEQTAYIPQGQSWLERMQAGLVLGEQGQALAPDTPFSLGLRIYYYRHVPYEPPVPFEHHILYQDAHLLVADKPHFLPVSPTGRYVQETLLVRLKKQTGLDDLTPIHRIDRDTAGVVLLSKQVASRNAYAAMFRARQAHKVYEAIAPFNPAVALPRTHTSRLVTAASFMQMHEVPGPANSTTHISLLEQRGPWARYQLVPITGQRHQLRVHMLALGLPLRFDAIYPVLTPEPALDALDYSAPLQLLAQSIAFDDPVTGQSHTFVSGRSLQWPQLVDG
jgi:tRNA pseudouridine32 synthase / 23S rRNA pseudouridine746 synthase